MNIVECGEIVATLSGTYPNATFTERSPQIWHAWLSEFDAAAVRAALRDICLQHPDFCPTPVRVAATMQELASTDKPIDLVWAEVMAVVARIANPDHRTAGMREIAAIDPLAAEVIDEGITWFALASTRADRNDSLYRRFRDGLTEARKVRRQDALRERVEAAAAGITALNGGAS